MRLLFLSVLAILFLPSSVFAAAEMGQPFPVQLSLKDSNDQVQRLEELRGDKGTVLVFVRSVDWCPYCQVQLLDLRSDAGEVRELGYNIVSVSYDDPEKLKAFKDRYKFQYPMLSDEGSEVIKALDILNDEYDEDHFAYGVPHPTVYILGYDGTVQAILSEEGYKKRPQPAVIIETIKGLSE
mgnify:CR=1 FL=1